MRKSFTLALLASLFGSLAMASVLVGTTASVFA